jgi:hypothetical protein
MTSIARAHTLSALLWMLTGMLFGLWMGAVEKLQFRPLHIGMMLGGFLTLAAVGAVFRLWPEMERYRFARLHFWTLQIGILGLNIGTLVQNLTGNIALQAVFSLPTLLGTALLLHGFWVTADRS